MKAHPAFVGAKRRVELHPEAAIDLNLSFVVCPRDAEDDLPFRLAYPLDQREIQVMWMFGHHAAKTFQHLMNGLMEFRLAGIATCHLGQDGLELFIDVGHVASICTSVVFIAYFLFV